MAEIGYQSGDALLSWSQMASAPQETNPDLVWPRSVAVYGRMRREESQVKSVLKAVTLPIRRTTWELDPAGVREPVLQAVSANLGVPIKGRKPEARPRRTRGTFSWSEHLRLALLELPYGHSIFEQVYESAQGLVRLRKLAWRPPETIAGFEVAADGGLVAVEQHSMGTRRVRIPIDRLVVYVNEREGANWAGESLLRSCYKNWLIKDRLLRSQALTVDRNGLGVPVYTGAPVPDGATALERDAWIAAERENGLALATAFRSGEQAGASIPSGAKLQLLGVEGDLPDADKPIRYHDEQIARAVLAHFLNLGTQTGSWALGTTFADFFVGSLQAVAMHIADVTQQHVIDDLVDLNWGEDEPAPQLVFDEIGAKSPATADAIKALVDCGAVTPDEGLEDYMRASHGLPVREVA
ncbi:phage portal protein family protein [Segatella copri]